MLRSNQEHQPQLATRTIQQGQQRTYLKENIGGEGKTYGRGTMRTYGSYIETSGPSLSTRLMALRGKPDRQDYQRRVDPLNDSKLLNRYIPNPPSKLESKRESETNLQRSFSFVNRDHDNGKTKTQTVKPPVDNSSKFSGTQQINRTELRKNSSFGMLEDDYKFRYEQNKESTAKLYDISKYGRDEQAPNGRVHSDYKKDFNRTLTTPKVQDSKALEAHGPPDDQRIESIDKINVKIKEILKCLNDTDKVLFEQSTPEPQKGYIAQQRLSTTVNAFSDEAWQDKPRSSTNTRSGIYYNNRSAQKKEETTRLTTQTDSTAKDREAVSQGKFQNPSVLSRTGESQPEQPKRPLNRDIDFEIRKIEDKIKKSYEYKIKLNIRFDDNKGDPLGRVETASKAVIARNNNRQKEVDPERSLRAAVIKTQQPAQEAPVLRSQVPRETQFGALRYSERPINFNPNTHSELHIAKAEAFSIKLIPVTCYIYEEAAGNRYCKRFIDTLRSQVLLDYELRNAKVWLDSAPGLEDKWYQIQGQLKKHGIELDINKIKVEFQSTLEYHNPFYTVREATGENLVTAVDKYAKARQHWHTKILNCFDGQQLQQYNFTEYRLDLYRKGHLTIEDFVRFLNMYTGTFYRNRDLVLIFRRLSSSEILYFTSMIRSVARQ